MLLGLIRELLMEVSQPLMLLLKVVLLVKNSDVMVQLDAYCSAIVKKIKDCYGWNGEVKFEPSVGAWIGEFPLYLRYNHEADPIDQDITGSPEVSTTNKEELATTVQEIASYQSECRLFCRLREKLMWIAIVASDCYQDPLVTSPPLHLGVYCCHALLHQAFSAAVLLFLCPSFAV